MSTRTKRCLEWLRWGTLIGLTVWSAFAVAQEPANRAEPSSPGSQRDSVSDSLRDLRAQVRELQEAVVGMRSDWQRARAETADLRRELDEVRAGTLPPAAVLRDAVATATSTSSTSTIRSAAAAAPASLQNVSESGATQDQSIEIENQKADQKKGQHAAALEEEYRLLTGKVDDQYQTKVESASKYRVRLSGIVLMNLVSNQGQVDSIDLPTLAFARQPGESGGSFGATLRQSEIGLEVFGPTLAGAKTRADLQVDLAGGFPPVPNGTESGLMRLRTATMRMDW